ncbi:L-threonylcarbamoyladenylate synthase [Thioalkalivibrio sp. XN279]|uniref:L-threonylcarbamoyladenylate synthase n=1 Tax=Thioalkalivibrio sp. XN279 TaxID=2714953 RepID=UPI00140D759A|nr:L-threonylcarbamoyladenylate synthase [Thioalkalivibrio sp. XN279]NHA13967.1 threonylcarbamoyl-AMP synthase [Thioalkalivibrio sp. XN279]
MTPPSAPVPVSPDAIARAAQLLRAGGVVAIPTETVYGLGAVAMNPVAVRRVFAIKGRPVNHPLIVHLASAEALPEWAYEIPDAAWLLAERFWPGPLTLVLPRRPRVPDEVTGGQDSVALRVPAQPVARELIAAAGALAAPSANRFGRVSPTTAAHVLAELGDDVDMILDAGPCQVGLESTIVSLLEGQPALLRPGGVTVAELEAVLGRPVVAPPQDLRAPGRLASHYAPATPLELVAASELPAQLAASSAAGTKVAVVAYSPDAIAAAEAAGTLVATMPADAAEYGRQMYATLRRLDAAGHDLILVEAPPTAPEWLAVRDRLTRAAHRG